MDRRYTIGVAVLGLLIAAAGISLTGTAPAGHEVVRCYKANNTCTNVTITERPIHCNEWYVGMGRDALHCNWTTRGVEDVTLITDHGNYVNAPFDDATYTVDRKHWSSTTDAYDLQSPWGIEFLPDGSALITDDPAGQNIGYLYHYDGELERIKTFDDVINGGVTGTLGMTLHPNFTDNPYIYQAYAYEWNTRLEEAIRPAFVAEHDDYFIHTKLVRMRYEDGTITDTEVLLDDIPQTIYESGTGLGFGPDGKLYMSTGVGAYPLDAPLDPDNLRGKILRMNPDGSIPDDNPYDNRVWAMGFKNVEGFDWHPDTGDMYAVEQGKNRLDELDRVVKGGNYGYRAYGCDMPMETELIHHSMYEDYISPVWCSGDSGYGNWTLAHGQGAFVDEPGHPWHGDLFTAGLRGAMIMRFDFEKGVFTDNRIFYRSPTDRRLRDVEWHDGKLWILRDHRFDMPGDSALFTITPR